jgi:hypothetical protein
MPFYDRSCANGHQKIDCYEPINYSAPACAECGAPTERVWLTKTAAVIQDSIEGGVLIHHGLCNADGSPRRYYSKSEMRQEATRRGLTQYVEHVPDRGSDRSRHTSRWI